MRAELSKSRDSRDEAKLVLPEIIGFSSQLKEAGPQALPAQNLTTSRNTSEIKHAISMIQVPEGDKPEKPASSGNGASSPSYKL